jgi:hypothetical protein
MQWYEWLGVVLTITGLIASIGAGIRFLVKHYFEEIKHELKPNSGTSMKDQVTRLEERQKEIAERQHEDDLKFENRLDKLENKLDDVIKLIIEKIG